jgi:hypothetical protein
MSPFPERLTLDVGQQDQQAAAAAAEARSFDGVLFESDGLIVGLKELVTLASGRFGHASNKSWNAERHRGADSTPWSLS